MTLQEFSNEFDVLLNSYRDIKSFGLTNSDISFEINEYEKSVFLTNAQRELVIELYSGRNNLNGYSYEEVEEIRRYLSTLNNTLELNPFSSQIIRIANVSNIYQLPNNTLYITIEQVKVDSTDPCKNKYIEVRPIRRDVYNRYIKNPFRKPNKDFAYRIDHQNNIVEIVYDDPLTTYKVGLLIKPSPIILEDLNYLSIEGISVASNCSLPEILHKEILIRAVQQYAVSLPQINKQ